MERATQERLVGATLLIVAGVILIPWLLDGSMTGSGVDEQELVLPGGRDSGNETRRISLEVPRQNSQGSGQANSASNSVAEAPSESVREVDARTVRGVDEPAAASLPKAEERQTSASKTPARFAKPMPASDSPPPAAVQTTQVAARIDPPVTVQPKPVSKPEPKPEPVKREVVATPPAAQVQPSSQPVSAGSGVWAVQVGSFASEENAERLAARLRDKSYKAFVMRNVIEGRVRFRVRVGPVSERNQAELLATALREDRQPARILSHP